jgi:DNA-binding CsgD family transcriptional regulator
LLANSLCALALVDAHIGRADEARAAAQEARSIAHAIGALPPFAWGTAVLGFLELSLGNPRAAHAHLAPLSEALASKGLGDPGIVGFLSDDIESLIELGEFGAAEGHLLALERQGRVLDRASALAAAARCRGLLEAADGDFDAARASLAEAARQHARIAHPFETGRTLLAMGTIERRAKRRSEARQALTRALELFDTLGAARWAEKAAAELARIPGRAAAAGNLTETERRVAELVADGLSNKEVAGHLFITVRTVEANLSKVYAKLGVRSRTELARRLSGGERS